MHLHAREGAGRLNCLLHLCDWLCVCLNCARWGLLQQSKGDLEAVALQFERQDPNGKYYYV